MVSNDALTFKGRFKVTGRDSRTGEVVSCVETDNKVLFSADRGLDLILDRLNGTNTYTLNILYCDIGTSGTAPTESDTGLGAAVARAAKAAGSISGKAITLQFFLADGDLANGTYREIGAYVDGSATLSTGQIFNHAVFGSPYVKGSNTDTTVELTITLSN